MRSADTLVAELALIVKEAVGPLLERLTATETKLVAAQAVVPDLQREIATLRERLAVAETKADRPPDPPPAVDFSPVLERLAVIETKAVDLRDRVGVIETKTVTAPLLTKAEPDHDLRDRLLSLERKGEVVAQDVTAVRERVVVLETRAPVPGPPGLNGKDGANGKDGVDGLGYDDLGVEFDGDRTMTLAFARGDQRKAFPITLAYMRNQGVYVEGKSYQVGDVVTWGGSMWHANEPTATKPGDGLKAWTLVVKRGRDGKDGRDAATAPVVGLR